MYTLYALATEHYKRISCFSDSKATAESPLQPSRRTRFSFSSIVVLGSQNQKWRHGMRCGTSRSHRDTNPAHRTKGVSLHGLCVLFLSPCAHVFELLDNLRDLCIAIDILLSASKWARWNPSCHYGNDSCHTEMTASIPAGILSFSGVPSDRAQIICGFP